MVIKLLENIQMFSSDRKKQAIENILKVSYNGNHLLVSSRKFYKDVIELDSIFSASQRQTAIRDLENVSFTNNIVQEVDMYMEVDFDFEGAPYVRCDNDKEIIVVSYLYFEDIAYTLPSTLLTENISDFSLYEILVEYYIKIKRLNCSYKLENFQGGGSTIKSVYDRLKQEEKLCLCLLDNDKPHPNANKKGTIDLFDDDEFQLTSTIKAFDIKVHEVESLLPMAIIEESINGYESKHQRAHDIFKKIVEEDSTTKYYFDHKEGFRVQDVIELDKKFGSYWLPIMKKYISNDCLGREECNCEPSCQSLIGYGTSFYNTSVDILKKYTHIKKKEVLNELEDKWLYIGKELLSWGISNSKIRCA